MSLFVCTECRTIDNTATAHFWTQRYERPEGERLCTACQTGKWHDRFPRRIYDGTQRVQWRDGEWVPDEEGAT